MFDLMIYLLAIIVIVPLSKFLGLGAVVGYLIAGALIGPHGFSLLHEMKNGTPELAEFGVIMMLLLIGLEMSPKLLWKMRGPIFGLGSLQVGLSILLFGVAGLFLGHLWPTALTIGIILAGSSTAIVLKTLQEQGYSKSTGGVRALSVLLFQDIAVVPMLAILPLLGAGESTGGSSLQRFLMTFGAVAGIIVAGRLISRRVFRWISKTKLREMFTALALFIVVGSAWVMHLVGVSSALGTFLAGVVLADSEFKHQIEADIEPFKGLLLGLFFITIGSSIELPLLVQQPMQILFWVAGIILLKSVLIYFLGRVTRMKHPESLLFGVSLAQGGEFAFVLIGQAGGLVSRELAQILTVAVAITMALTPVLILMTVRLAMCQTQKAKTEKREPDQVAESEKNNPILVIGVGRFGQTLIRFLRANGIASTVLDIDSEQIEIIGRFGIKSYFGDGSNPDLLMAAGLDRCRALVIAIDEAETTLKIAETVRALHPKLPIFARVYDRLEAYKMLHLGVHETMIETSGSAIALATEILKTFGFSPEQASARGQLFHINNQRSIKDLSKRYLKEDRDSFIQASREMAEQLEAIFRTDPDELSRGAYSEWPKNAAYSGISSEATASKTSPKSS